MINGGRFSRRSFLVVTGTWLAGWLAGCTSKSKSEDDTNVGPWTPPDEDSGLAEGDCSLTEADNPGPFYVPGVPVRNELDLYDHAGMGLTVSGRVLDADCNPIANAVVEIWHAAPTTVAVEELTEEDSVGYDNNSPQMRYRGQIATDNEGAYSFHTKKPGWYLNRDTFRPQHIHIKVHVDGVERLTTQLYFDGDPYLDGDPWATPSRSVAVSPNGDGEEIMYFDIVV